MHLTNCLNPTIVVINGEERKVPCGCCEYCRFVRSMSLIERFRLESQEHKYGVFVTLTYANPFLPCCKYSEDAGGFYVPDCFDCYQSLFTNDDEGLFFNFPHLSDYDAKKLASLEKLYGFVPRLKKTDLQDFFKRFRINIKRKICDKLNLPYEEFKVSYLACGEYGPTGYRPHFHFCMLFDRPEIAKEFEMLLRSAWSYGSSSFRFCTDDRAIKYVAQYINGFSDLPSFYKTKGLRPFLLISKAEPVGLSKISEEKIIFTLINRSPTISVYDAKKGTYCDVCLWQFLENRLFPRFTGFDIIPHWLRVRLVGTAASARSYEEFMSLVEEAQIQRYNTILLDYYELFNKTPKDCSFFLSNRRLCSCMYRLYLASKRIVANIRVYGRKIHCSSIAEYMALIDDYYHNKKQYQLKQQLEFEESFMPKHPDWLKYIDLMTQDRSVYDTSDFHDVFDVIHNINQNQRKKKAKNEYLQNHPEYMVLHSHDEFLEGFKSSIY